MGLNKEELSKLLQTTVMTVCENAVVFSRNICIQAVIFVEVDGEKFCSLSFREERESRNSVAADSLEVIGKIKSEQDEISGVAEEINGDANNMFSEAVRVWYNDPIETGSSCGSQPQRSDSYRWKEFDCSTPERETSDSRHTAKRLHRCETCGADFTFISNLRRHRKTFHNIRRPLVSISSADCATTNSLTFVSQTSVVGNNTSGLLMSTEPLGGGGYSSRVSSQGLFTAVKNESVPIPVNDENGSSTHELSLTTRPFENDEHRDTARAGRLQGSAVADLLASSKHATGIEENVASSALESTVARAKRSMPAGFKCKFCGESFMLEWNLRRHVQFYHNSGKVSNNNAIGRSLEEAEGGVLEQAQAADDAFAEDPACHICGKVFVSAVDCKRHVSMAHRQLTGRRLAETRREPHETVQYGSTLNGGELQKLLVQQQSQNSISEPITSTPLADIRLQRLSVKRSATSSSSQPSRRGVPPSKYKFACSICNARFTFQTNVTRHMKNMHKIRVSSLGLLHGGDQLPWQVRTEDSGSSSGGHRNDGDEENSREHCVQQEQD